MTELRRSSSVRLQPLRPSSTEPPADENAQEGLRATSSSADGESENWVPLQLWNDVVSRNGRSENPNLWGLKPKKHARMPFNRVKDRSYGTGTIDNLMGKVSSKPLASTIGSGPHSKSLLEVVVEEAAEERPTMRPEQVPSRAEALQLIKSYEEMEHNIRNNLGGLEPEVLAREAAFDGDADRVLSLLEPKIYGVDVFMTELAKQVQVGCRERGELLERCRSHFLSMFSICALTLGELVARHEVDKDQKEELEKKVAPLESGSDQAVQKIASMELELQAARESVKFLEEELEATKRSMAKTRQSEERSRSEKEQALVAQLEEAESINSILKSKLAVVDAQLKQAESNNGVLQVKIQELQERIRRDAGNMETLSESIARTKLTLTWMRCLAYVRRERKSLRKEATTQDGLGLDGGASALTGGGQDGLEGELAVGLGGEEVDGGMAGEGGPGEAEGGAEAQLDENGKPVPKRKRIISRGHTQQAIPFTVFWGQIIKMADNIDFIRTPDLKMSKPQMLDFISRIYTEKILVDEVDDRIKMPRQSLAEFLYDYHLELLNEPILAEEALVNIVANVKHYDRQSPRVRMFTRFLGLDRYSLSVEALSFFLVGLVKVQNGQVPLLPDFDNQHVESAKAMKVIEHVFAQAPYVVRTRVLLECEKRSVGKQIDLDSFLLFMVEMWKEEQGRSEERLRALFVASDSDGNGNLDFHEFHGMVKRINSSKTHRELLRMYSEMTLNRLVDSNTFVRVCRKFKFFNFDLRPTTKRQDNPSYEVFELLNTEWKKIEDMVHEMLVVLEGTAVGKRLEQNVSIMKKMLQEKMEAEQAWICYRKIVAEFTSAVRNRTPKPEPAADPPKARVRGEGR